MTMKVFLMLLFVLLLHLPASAQKLSVEVSYGVAKKNISFTLDYKNPKSDTIVLWIQNWRFVLLEDRNVRFNGFPYISNLVNYIFVLDDSISLLNQLSSAEYSQAFERSQTQVSMAKIPPHGHFTVKMKTADKKLIKFIKKNHFKVNLIASYTSLDSLSKIKDFSSIKFYVGESIDLKNLPVTGNKYEEIATFNYKFSDDRNLLPISTFNLNEVFDKYMLKIIPNRTSSNN